MIGKIAAAALVCLMLTGCSAVGNSTSPGESSGEVKTESTVSGTEVVTGEAEGTGLVRAFAERVDKHDLAVTLSSVQPGGMEVVEKTEVCGNILHDAYYSTDGSITAEMYIVDGSIWSMTNEGVTKPVYNGFDDRYDAHVRECVLHWMNIGEGEYSSEMISEDTEKITSVDGSLVMTYTFGEDGVPVRFEGGGAEYTVTEFSEGTGSIELPQELKDAIAEREGSTQ